MISVAISALILAQAATPAAATLSPAPVAVEQPQKSEKKICKVDPNYTGTRMRKKLCLTETQWTKKSQGKDAADLKNIGAR